MKGDYDRMHRGDLNDPRNIDNTLDFQAVLGNLLQQNADIVNDKTVLSVAGQTYQHWQTKEKAVASHRSGKNIYFVGDNTPHNGNDWEVCYS